MYIRKDAWHYKVWEFTYAFKDFETPEQTSLCRYVSRTLLYPVPIGLLMVGFVSAVALVVIVLPNVIIIPLGIGTYTEWKDDHQFKRFGAVSVAGRRVPMWVIICSLWALLALTVLVSAFPSQVGTAATYGAYGVVGVALLVSALYILCIVGMTIVSACRSWEGWDVAKQYLKAKKQGICPLVFFDEPNHPAPAEVGEPKVV